jgi:hypothetical protein
MIRCAALNLLVVLFMTATCSAVEFANHADLVRIFGTEKFKLFYRVRQISERDWIAAGVRPQGRSITASMVDPGQRYQSWDFGIGDKAQRQLFVAATNPRHEVLCFWEATNGGPVLRVLMLERDRAKSNLIFYAIMNNDIPHERWTWDEVKKHILQNKIDVFISAEHPDVYDNRLP